LPCSVALRSSTLQIAPAPETSRAVFDFTPACWTEQRLLAGWLLLLVGCVLCWVCWLLLLVGWLMLLLSVGWLKVLLSVGGLLCCCAVGWLVGCGCGRMERPMPT